MGEAEPPSVLIMFPIKDYDEDLIIAALIDSIREVPEEARDELLFEINMFHSRLELLGSQNNRDEFENTYRLSLCRETLYEFLRKDLEIFLKKLIENNWNVGDLPELSVYQREITALLKEIGVSEYRTSPGEAEEVPVLELWFHEIAERFELSPRKIVNYLEIYKNRMHMLGGDLSGDDERLKFQIRRLLISEQFEITFEELYNAEIALRREILFVLLKRISSSNRMEYLVQKALVMESSNGYVNLLHEEYSENYRELLRIQKKFQEQILKQKESLDSELRMATELQSLNLQQELPQEDPRIRFALWYEPFMGLGGDYYRILRPGENEYAILMADIAGHGISAAMFMNTLHLAFEGNISACSNPGEMFEAINRELCGKLGNHFVTAICIYMNLEERQLRYCNCGLPRAILQDLSKGDAGPVFFPPNSKVLGLFPSVRFEDCVLSINDHHRLIVFTDGITETIDEGQRILGDDGFLELVEGLTGGDPEEMIESIRSRLLVYQGEASRQDDRCLIVGDIRLSR